MVVIQRRRAAISVSTLRNDIKGSVSEEQDCVNISRFCDHYMVCSQIARRRVKLKGNRKRCGEETEKVQPVFPRESYSANFR